MGNDNSKQDQQRKPPLKWEQLDVIEKGRVRVEINGAEGQKGRLHSIRLGKVLPSGKIIGFFNKPDFTNLKDAIQEAEYWIEADRVEQQNKSKKKNKFNKG